MKIGLVTGFDEANNPRVEVNRYTPGYSVTVSLVAASVDVDLLVPGSSRVLVDEVEDHYGEFVIVAALP